MAIPTAAATPAATVAHPITTPDASATTPLIVFVGSVQTNAAFVSDQDSYPGQVIRMLAPTTYDYALVGLSHITTATLASQAPKTVDPLRGPARSKNIVVMWEGEEELYNGADPETAYANLAEFCTARKAAGWQVVIVTLLPRPVDAVDIYPTRAHYEADRQTINARLRANWSQYADALADVASNPQIGPVETLSNGAVYHIEDFRGLYVLTIMGRRIAAQVVKNAILTL
jgi:hypothetical protein